MVVETPLSNSGEFTQNTRHGVFGQSDLFVKEFRTGVAIQDSDLAPSHSLAFVQLGQRNGLDFGISAAAAAHLHPIFSYIKPVHVN